MPQRAAAQNPTDDQLVIPNLLPTCTQALRAAEKFAASAREAVRQSVAAGGRIDAAKLEAEQVAAHGYAWLSTYVTALRETLHWAERIQAAGKFSPLEQLIVQAAFGEYLAQMAGGIAISQVEIVRPADMNAAAAALDLAADRAVALLVSRGNGNAVRMEIARHVAAGNFGELGLDDETLVMIREQFRRFAEDKVIPFAHDWHRKDEFIPMSVIDELAQLGVFGLTVPEEWGGLGLGKVSMCIVTEELARAYIGVGSLGTRSEIAAELIRSGGTEAQKKKWLPLIAGGEILPTAVFTEPNTGSDLASLKTRAIRDGDIYKVTGNKTWITHAARADVMT
ncbi:MAG: acyl-CoA dehydrogenase family protein, partial [Alphaproteobacteria bacterium]